MEFCQSEKVGTLNVDIHTNYMRAVYLSCFVLMTCRFKYIYRPQRSCGQGNIFRPVCHSVHRGGGGFCLSACWDTPLDTRPPPPPGADTLPPTPDTTRHPGHQTPPPGHQTPDTPIPRTPEHPPPPPGSRLQYTVYERPVRILLECILVLIFFLHFGNYL